MMCLITFTVTRLCQQLLDAFCPFLGLFGATFIEIFSARVIAIVGVLFTAIGFFLGAFSTNFYHLGLTYGVLIGRLAYLFFT